MQCYIKVGDLKQTLKEYYLKTGARLQFEEAVVRMERKGLTGSKPKPGTLYAEMCRKTHPDDFESFIDELIFPAFPNTEVIRQVYEEDMFPMKRDVFIFPHPRYTRPQQHRHDFFEVDFVADGQVRLYFEEEVHSLSAGAVCLIAPGSLHDLEVLDEGTVYSLMIRRSTFETTFFSLLSRDDALSLFFRNILQQKDEPNYLIFQLKDSLFAQGLIEQAMLECFSTDDYANNCAVSMVPLIFAEFLRQSGDSSQFYHYRMSTDFSTILHYIRHHYQTLSLARLAEEFHYSKPHLCTLIKQNTGVSFTELIRRIRMTRAKDYLINTSLPVRDIADILGYHSADHFSRVFRSTYGCSPHEYRCENANSDDKFVPFEMN